MMMIFRKTSTLLIVFVMMISVAILIGHGGRVEASRVLSEADHFANTNHLETYSSSIYERAKHSMAYWLERLPSGPSPSGPGH
ncbi:hypothetical protein I3843_02G087600 [Carya illinoinensis]|uniref:Uncharacterized protein n=1 Tax=Carya illinoinensis TaxID=32201 RepID=A0A8T1RD67_CARIL|nr:hypothetical protein I3760_02G102800 [Carya illinoinensis]KAG6664575.1 hypothetical protein CIPAW_02G102700 [Carya illinoinensis]KAG6726848.1 hypothetical protein I3842_02G101000 [Carya illinoinensis]KAG7991647.1 hypothetical protein I3843_02G087600 [Carya illinoinensis]